MSCKAVPLCLFFTISKTVPLLRGSFLVKEVVPFMKLLLHICCAPCSISCIQQLRADGIEPVGYWNNPNIHPYTEYRSRKTALEQYANGIGLTLVLEGEYGLRPFVRAVADRLDDRCGYCYQSRLEPAAQYAAAHGFEGFCSTLQVSPYQNYELLCQTGERMAKQYGVAFVPYDFRPGFREGQQQARALGLYMQKYCGCIFSEEERYRKKRK